MYILYLSYIYTNDRLSKTFLLQKNSSNMSLKFVTRKLKTQTLGDDDGDLKEVSEKDVRSGESVKSESKNKEDNDVSFYTINYFR